jgi:hypothetical protein
MKANEVRPQKWLWDENYPIRILYDDDEYSVIWGKYENVKALGVRWNGGTDVGYPGQGGHPTWYVEPDFIAIAILQRLLTLAVDNNDREYLDNIIFAIQELRNKMTRR